MRKLCVAAIGVMRFSCVALMLRIFLFTKEKPRMPDYKSMYYNLFNSVTEAVKILSDAQKRSEEIYITSSEIDDEKLKQFKVVKKENE